jgi:polyhydroxybutyrate depolymerase
MHMRLGTMRWLLALGVFAVSAPRAETTERPCAFNGIRRGTRPPCVGVERTVLGRTYCIHTPAASKPGLPVVLLLHGYSSNGEAQSQYFDLDGAVERRGFILVKPNGTPDAGGRQYWTAGRHLNAPNAPDDIAYLSAVLDDVVTTFGADTSRIFAVGHSNGAFMANYLACKRSERLAAIVSLAGAVDPETCHPAQPVSVLTVHGTADVLIQYGGGNSGFHGTYPSADASLSFWAKADGCKGARTPGKALHLTCDSPTPETDVSTYSGCPAGIGVEHWKLDGVGHIPNFALPAWPDALLDFLWAHPKPKPPK